ncbi:TIGR03013 family XrtA/PEP-CTERM system glycosyltransferase [Desulfonema magnum]|uniref:Exopolysaccharide biosynthesis polyprenyl glycosylphosphotransferase n=1 Tax=Desulfonema magnum TaxID=45655 RepID=A0A975BWL3_9BACT|nr:TIGR03013 family XrtA/PEP-CTERM system glycosyltransferase [Desulfonema magnum]QTA93008.1 Exopolysaccharide biosynthesis polyprenyl glycosylphosphotransferase [Desulfonema magnum]
MFSVRSTSGSITIIIGDMIICYLFFGLILPFLAYSPEWLSLSSLYGYLTFSVLTLVVILSLCFTRLYSFMEYIYPVDLIKRILPAFALSFVSIATMGFFIKSVILLSWRLLLPLVPIYGCMFIFRYLVFYGLTKNRERILIVGVTTQAREIIKESHRKRFRGYEIVGIVTSQEAQVATKTEGVSVLGLMENVQKIVQEHTIDSIVVTLRERRGKLPVYELLGCKVKNIRIEEGFTFYEKIKRKIIIDEFLKPSWFIFETGFFYTSIHGFAKRTQGMIVSFILLTFLSPILVLVAILIKLESPGPVFFQQERVGLNGKPFRLLKFRSMCQDAEKMIGPAFAQKNDPRITRLGMLTRKIRLDEVPQFINIFKGDMDLVGPRPERPVFVSQLEKIVPYYNLRHVVRPGLTGWAQVNYPYGDSFEDSREKLKYDLYYVKHFSWYLDLLIVFLTIREVLFSKGR